MRLTRLLLKRGWWRGRNVEPESAVLRKHGPIKWKDFQSRFIDPPYWYKWTTNSPYHPIEQQKIMSAESVAWYRHNFHKQKIVPPHKWLFKVGDKVEVLVGKDKGKQGDVIQAIPEGNLVVVGGMNCKYERRGMDTRRIEEPYQHHELSLLDPKDRKPVKVEFRVDEMGKRTRVSERTGHIIEWPPDILPDGTEKQYYVCGDKDTSVDDACKRTYKPTMEFWEDEMKRLYGIDDPPRRETFWY